MSTPPWETTAETALLLVSVGDIVTEGTKEEEADDKIPLHTGTVACEVIKGPHVGPRSETLSSVIEDDLMETVRVLQ